MKKVSLLLALFLMASSVMAFQESGTMAPKKSVAPKKAAVDCSATDDTNITTDVKERLGKATSLKSFAINVATSSGVVTLTGAVKTGLNKGTATRVAKSAPCVKKVDNQLTVETARTSSDEIKKSGR